MIKRTAALGADEAFDPLGHIDPTAPTFYREAAAVAAYLITGEGLATASSRCVLTAAIMHHALLAARENRPCSMAEVHSALTEASRKIRHLIPSAHIPRTSSRQAAVGVMRPTSIKEGI